uniref:Uncharacterized protein n=1 Tax=Dikerogammarus haemobaphes virus 1 TaxID=2704946 RepID=A0A6G9HE41_9VIRU|nr:hypothetical protein [Dikerogammarus haemobaphes virus 1]
MIWVEVVVLSITLFNIIPVVGQMVVVVVVVTTLSSLFPDKDVDNL